MLALANKESMVCAGELLKRTCAAHGTRLIPVDSEHSAIFQALQGERIAEVERIILTASGGPFRDWSVKRMTTATPSQAKAHPNWDMGERISIDSATMFNKALEVIEAHALFDVNPERIEVLVHPQSIVHSMVGFRDGSIIAQLGPSDMRGAIGYALNWPERRSLPVERLDFAAIGRLDFTPADPERFPALRLAREVLTLGGLAGAVFNAAKEAALDAFLAGAIGFLDMAVLVEHVLEKLGPDAAALRPRLRSRGGHGARRRRSAHERDLGRSLLRSITGFMDAIAGIPFFGGFLSTVLPFVVVLGIVVFVHEYGHYIVARWCGIKSDVFSIGFGPVIWSRKDRQRHGLAGGGASPGWLRQVQGRQ